MPTNPLLQNPFTNPLSPTTITTAPAPKQPFSAASNPFSASQLLFAAHLINGTGLSGAVVMGWMAAEEPVGADTRSGSGAPQDWLNIGLTDSGPRGTANSFWNDAATAGDTTAEWLRGTLQVPGFGTASAGIQGILRTAGQPDSVQISAIQRSGWATSGYPSLPSLVATYGKYAPGGSFVAAGGTAGLGGTGTKTNDVGTLLNDSSGFTVGDATNPDEDYWTAINRLCQDRYWYCFSDGETLYIADGPDLMKQAPAMSLDRVADMAIINHLDFTWDNTAWQYAATHKKRKRSQRRTQLAKVTSPVEATVNVICKIDEIRAGDVANLNNTGPGDGQWLVGDVRRSVFQVLSEVTLVPALSPLSEGELNPAGVNPTNKSPLSAPTGGVRKLLNAARGLIGTPYEIGGHSSAINEPPATIRRQGTDCSGFISYLMGPEVLGIWTTAYATPSIPTAPDILPGPGAQVTLWNNPRPGSSGHVWIDIGGTFFECAGGGLGVHQMSAGEVANYKSQGVYLPLHPGGL